MTGRFARLVAATVFAVCALLGEGRAEPAPAVEWTDPTGRVTLAFDELGWTPIDRANLQLEEGDILLIEHNAFQADRQMRVCAMRSVLAPDAPPGMTHDQVNQAIELRTHADYERTVGAPLTSLSRATLSGVAVATFTFERGNTLQYWRLFYLSHGGVTIQMNLTCGASLPANAAERANFETVINTLNILPSRP